MPKEFGTHNARDAAEAQARERKVGVCPAPLWPCNALAGPDLAGRSQRQPAEKQLKVYLSPG